jgi:hypothetical protein
LVFPPFLALFFFFFVCFVGNLTLYGILELNTIKMTRRSCTEERPYCRDAFTVDCSLLSLSLSHSPSLPFSLSFSKGEMRKRKKEKKEKKEGRKEGDTQMSLKKEREREVGRDRESVIQSGPAGGSFAPRLPQTVNRAFGRGDGGGSGGGGDDGVSFVRSSSRFSM